MPLDFADGMVIDAQGSFMVCDENAPGVDLIAPPYNPNGSLAATIGSEDGLTYPAGAVDSENAVY